MCLRLVFLLLLLEVSWGGEKLPADFTAFRKAYEASPDYLPDWEMPDWDMHRDRNLIFIARNAEDFRLVLRLTKTWLAQCPIDAGVHAARAEAAQARGDAETARYHRAFADGLHQSVLKSGDGLTPATAYQVVSLNEVMQTVDAFGAMMYGQSRAGALEKVICKFPDGTLHDRYFDVRRASLAMEEMNSSPRYRKVKISRAVLRRLEFEPVDLMDASRLLQLDERESEALVPALEAAEHLARRKQFSHLTPGEARAPIRVGETIQLAAVPPAALEECVQAFAHELHGLMPLPCVQALGLWVRRQLQRDFGESYSVSLERTGSGFSTWNARVPSPWRNYEFRFRTRNGQVVPGSSTTSCSSLYEGRQFELLSIDDPEDPSAAQPPEYPYRSEREYGR